jgi:hypothetical protein
VIKKSLKVIVGLRLVQIVPLLCGVKSQPVDFFLAAELRIQVEEHSTNYLPLFFRIAAFEPPNRAFSVEIR